MPDIDDDRDRVSHEDDHLRHEYLADATVLGPDDEELYVIAADEPGQQFWHRLARAPHPKPYR